MVRSSTTSTATENQPAGLEPNEPPNRLFGRFGVAALAVAGLVLLMIVGSSAWIAVVNRGRLERVEQAEATQALIASVRTSMESAETGQRGYLLTGRPDYLAPYDAAIARLPGQLAALRQATQALPSASGLVDRLVALVHAKLAELASTIALYRSGDTAGAHAIVLTDQGQVAMVAVRDLLDALAGDQRTTLRQLTQANNSANFLLVAIGGLGLAAMVVLAGLLGVGVWQTMTILRAAQIRLAAMNDTLEETVARRTADLSEANAEIQRFAYIVSHDLRAPLVNIMGFTGELEVAASILRKFTDNLPVQLPLEVRLAAQEDLPEAIHFIRASTGKMDRLIGAILRISREGQRVLTPEPLAMRDILTTIADTLRHQALQGDMEIVVEQVPDLVADKLAVEQVFANIVENALKYAMPGRPGRVVLRGRASDRLARYDIEDNGRGIAAKDRQRIFELFRRAGDQTVPGEGIGLAHVRALVRRLGGRIECESTPEVGSVFRVYLPLRAAGDTMPRSSGQARAVEALR